MFIKMVFKTTYDFPNILQIIKPTLNLLDNIESITNMLYEI